MEALPVEEGASTAEGQEEEPLDEAVFPIEVTYHTPSQAEGPYYPVEKPAERDNDLVVLEDAGRTAAGEILVFGGRLYDAAGMPVAGAVVEIWQTDDNGAYLHPRDPDSWRRDVNFQSYGEAVTGEDGGYSFRTIMPGSYAPRPRHIHVKVRLGEQELLTTQFYFSNDPEVTADRIFAGAADDGKALIMVVEEGLDAAGNSILTRQAGYCPAYEAVGVTQRKWGESDEAEWVGGPKVHCAGDVSQERRGGQDAGVDRCAGWKAACMDTGRQLEGQAGAQQSAGAGCQVRHEGQYGRAVGGGRGGVDLG